MILAYLDESGDTGINLSDPEQPIFVLAALLIEQEKWKKIENDFSKIIAETFSNVSEKFEIHAIDLVRRDKEFSRLSQEECIKFRNSILNLIGENSLQVVYRKIEKKKFQKYCEDNFGSGIKIHPYIMAFPFIGLKIEEILKEKNELGILIFDEHRSLADIELSLKTLRLQETGLKMERVIEKGFFLDSSKSYALQMIDLFLYYIRKFEESKIGRKVSPVHQEIFPLVEKLAVNLDGFEKGNEIRDWVGSRIQK